MQQSEINQIWQAIRDEAKELANCEPMLASFSTLPF